MVADYNGDRRSSWKGVEGHTIWSWYDIKEIFETWPNTRMNNLLEGLQTRVNADVFGVKMERYVTFGAMTRIAAAI